MTTDRKSYEENLEKLVAAETKLAELQRLWNVEREIIEASRRGPPLAWRAYARHKDRLHDIETAMSAAKRVIFFRETVFYGTPTPRPRRPRKTVMIDGIRTKLERV
jgi:hypothetical protein